MSEVNIQTEEAILRVEEKEEVFDEGLQGIFGNRYQDGSGKCQPVKKASPKMQSNGEPQDAIWKPVKEKHFPDKLLDAGKNALIYGGLSFLFFYWQQTGQMEPSAAVPCMCACTMMVGWGIGKYTAR